ncbi:PAS domain-containing protein [Parvularcula maris]|uniref:PAS domain-containing protein n=1 Tax=Parvularcula maris TaxID=2965077 RepID=A0A9X2RID6_9PROT|nr:PAS domain-containing protein [Parvularcula maris]MCQ8185879.1 PAS domain-containing protein [Parvularcula maris]
MSDRDRQSSIPRSLLRRGLNEVPLSLVITDPRQDDNPIVYVNRAFTELTGYEASAIIGRNCRFLQGEDTEPSMVQELRESIDAERQVTVDLTNYRADGEAFCNRLMITPLKDENGTVTHFLGVQTLWEKQSAERATLQRIDDALRQMQHDVGNHLSTIVAITRLEAYQGAESDQKADLIADRMEAISLVYEMRSAAIGQLEEIPLSAYLTQLIASRVREEPSEDVELRIDTGDVCYDPTTVGRIGLAVGEMLRVASEGKRTIGAWVDGSTVRIEISDSGEISDWPEDKSLSGRIAADLARRIGGEVSQNASQEGRVLSLNLPVTLA